MKLKEKSVLRIIDVNVNRSCEGLRVLEDILRLRFSDKEITLRLKNLRHRIREVFSFRAKDFLSARDAESDVGRGVSRIEDKRENLKEVIDRNIKRAEESLRTLEEMGKLISIRKSHLMKKSRFLLYSIEKDIQRIIFSKKHFSKQGIYVILPDAKRKKLIEIAKAVSDAPVSAIQIRCKEMPAKEQVTVAKEIRKITAKNGITFIVNDRIDIALTANADGVHIGQDDMSILDARKLVGFDFTIGVSTHSLEEAKRAEGDGADYVAFGSIYPTKSKENAIVQGSAILRKFCSKMKIPVVAIGGIRDYNIGNVAAAGADYAAVISYICDSVDPAIAVIKLYRNFIKGKKNNNR